MEDLESALEELGRGAREIAEFILRQTPPVGIEEVQDRDGIEKAMRCIHLMKLKKVYDRQELALINPDVNKSTNISPLNRGEVVLIPLIRNAHLPVIRTYSIQEMNHLFEEYKPFFEVINNFPRGFVIPIRYRH